ncbi:MULTISPECIES: hypothetical protein [Streptomyces]|uniref:Uncharacterized protein n=1 Tax=Streptomyces venezuelae TaxID=54571 RepID=A0A5P2BEG9_STRVZ|nr:MULTISPECIES: hypothetical protein [Streptomyces]MYZ15169.1 hypothetical protein [Streptomyces sp. SID337]NDZ86446.1 hypothetical protein [Streptomyces sp. SID10115]NEB45926.1 hypothetical protein [Streptomyces sp. SID339]QES28736.1 hypothetical protein DEJ47_21925 [Streptomyces venezuelae]
MRRRFRILPRRSYAPATATTPRTVATRATTQTYGYWLLIQQYSPAAEHVPRRRLFFGRTVSISTERSMSAAKAFGSASAVQNDERSFSLRQFVRSRAMTMSAPAAGRRSPAVAAKP